MTTHTPWPATAWALSIAICAAPAIAQNPSTDPVLEALSEVRDNRADLFVPRSSILGDLPGPDELARAQPQFRELFASGPAEPLDFTEADADALRRMYRCYTFTGSSRSGLTPLGITGAYITDIAWKPELVVNKVLPDTPAAGKLKVDDIIIGVNGRRFRDRRDPRIPMGYALYESQTAKLGGKLMLHLVRDGKPMNVALTLPVGPEYSDTWPYHCQRSKRIGDQLVRFVIDIEAGHLMSRHGGGGYWAPLFLMASGEPEAMDLVYRHFGGMLTKDYPEPGGGHSWNCSYNLVNLCEYYLLTGDADALPGIRYYSAVLLAGSSAAGGWGHSCPCSGYGEVNNVGFVALNGLALARRIGIDMDQQSLAKSVRYFGRFIATSPPYGDHGVGLRAGRGDNGSAAMGALAFKFLGESDVGQRWGRTICYMWPARERGHAERIFNFSWGPQGAALGSPQEFAMFMNNLLWYFEIARTPEGGLRHLQGGHFPYPVGQTTAVGLAYMLPRKQIYLTGAEPSVFEITPPDAATTRAAQLYREKKWPALQETLESYLADDDSQHKAYARKLLEKYRRLERDVAVVLKLAAENLDAGDIDDAVAQLDAMQRLLGGTTPQIEALRARRPKPIERNLPPFKQPEPEATLFAYEDGAQPSFDWEPILPFAEEAMESRNETYRIFRSTDDAVAPPGDWTALDYAADGWSPQRGPVFIEAGKPVYIRRTFRTLGDARAYKHLMIKAGQCTGELYLNGYRIAEFDEGELYLQPGATRALLDKADNVLAARLQARDTVNEGVDSEVASPPAIT